MSRSLSFPVLATAFALALPVNAEQKMPSAPEAADISGEWGFTANTNDDCSFTGTALLTRTSDPNRFGCELTALQMCTSETWQVRQSCSAVRLDDQLIINSEIEEFLQGEPNQGYLPDNFSLKIKSSDFMKGVLLSWGRHSAEFRRTEDVIG
tara:strand:+ start:1357 stop:1812 length:456 start_codon:yes stop_codon:yes gene_type:complete